MPITAVPVVDITLGCVGKLEEVRSMGVSGVEDRKVYSIWKTHCKYHLFSDAITLNGL